MQTSRRAAMAGSVFIVALATGYVMQNGDALASRFVAEPRGLPDIAMARPAAPLAPVAGAPLANGIALPVDPTVISLATPAPDAFSRAPLPDAGLAEVSLAPETGLSPYGMPCGVSLTATPAPAAMVHLSLEAACHGGEPVTVRQGPLTFTEATGTDGHLDLLIPALAAEAAFEVSFLDGSVVDAVAEVPEATAYERVALQWQGATGLGLHAFEYSATYGDPGHVHAAAAHTPDRALRRGVGFLTRLGRESVPGGWVSEVYSFPAADAQERGVVRVTVEAEVTEGTCGRDVMAQTLQPGIGDQLDSIDLALSVPPCDAVGEFLVLNNVLRDMKIAAN